MPRQLVIASKNPDKVREVGAILSQLEVSIEIVDGLDWPDVDEVGESLEENAILKAEAVARATGLAALADDTGLEVVALGGQPGLHTARYAGAAATYSQNVQVLLQALEGQVDRRARFRTVVALADPEAQTVVAEGSLDGRIAVAPRGSTGFGYDPIFEVEGRTLAEMTSSEKNELSHRRRAIASLAELADL